VLIKFGFINSFRHPIEIGKEIRRNFTGFMLTFSGLP
jgi:hypothetical protein